MAFNPVPIQVKDGRTANKSLIAFTNGTSSAFANPLLDATGQIINPASAELQAVANAALTAIATASASSDASLETVIANTGAGSVSLTATPAVAASSHASGDGVGTKINLAGAVRVAGGSGIIQTVAVNVQDNVSTAYDVMFFKGNPSTTITDDGRLDLVAADHPLLIGTAQCATVIDLGTGKSLQAANVALPFKLVSGTILYAVIVARGTAAYTTPNGVTLSVGILQD